MACTFLLGENDSVLFVGLACLDIANVIDQYPVEDISQRCLACKWQTGGNATNSATVFSLLGGKASYFGTLADSSESALIINAFKKYSINFDNCPKIENATCPLSIVILNKSGGTRTVLHTNLNLRELTLDDLKNHLDLTLDIPSWIHFEGRDNVYNIFQMLTYVNDCNDKYLRSSSQENGTNPNNVKHIVVSLEAEKMRFAPGMDEYNLWQLPDVLFVSKDFAKGQGYHNMRDAAQGYFKKLKKGAYIICAWGEHGAAAMSEEEGLVTSSAFPPTEIVDTCGAGDTFNAAVIKALSSGKNLQDSIVFGCKIAGSKCGYLGYDGVKDFK